MPMLVSFPWFCKVVSIGLFTVMWKHTIRTISPGTHCTWFRSKPGQGQSLSKSNSIKLFLNIFDLTLAPSFHIKFSELLNAKFVNWYWRLCFCRFPQFECSWWWYVIVELHFSPYIIFKSTDSLFNEANIILSLGQEFSFISIVLSVSIFTLKFFWSLDYVRRMLNFPRIECKIHFSHLSIPTLGYFLKSRRIVFLYPVKFRRLIFVLKSCLCHFETTCDQFTIPIIRI